jgi:CubicO group peptidase (beta-lactamase class C family)
MRRVFFCLAFLALLVVAALVIFRSQTTWYKATSNAAKISKKAPETLIVDDDPRFAPIDVAVQDELKAAQIPGAVILVGHKGRVVYRKAFGWRSLEPLPQPMTVDTIFDIASLTKVVGTTTAIMQLSDHGLLGIDDFVVKYWPEFGQNGKNVITLRQLLIHTSGLRVAINTEPRWSDYQGALEAIAGDRLIYPPGIKFRYSDVDFIILGEIVQRISGHPLDVYCTKKIFQPLKMGRTLFNPPANWQAGIAPCNQEKGVWRWGKVQDPNAYQFGGVAGHAGIFSTADDLSLFAQMLLNGGESRGVRILSRRAVVAMTKPQDIPGSPIRRGLGWDIQSPFSEEFNTSFPAGSFGHTGFTGTSIWIDPDSQTYLIILTNRLHPRGIKPIKSLRIKVAAAVAAAVHMGPPAQRTFATVSD